MNSLSKGIITLVLYFLYPFLLGALLPTAINSNPAQIVLRVLFDVVFTSSFIMLYKKN